jgi:hypothetical protein
MKYYLKILLEYFHLKEFANLHFCEHYHNYNFLLLYLNN